MKRFLSILLLALGILSIPSDRGPTRALAGSPAREAVIDPRVLEDTADGRRGHFLVVLRSQADAASAASRSADPEDRARRVFETLHSTADSSQSPIRAALDALHAPYRAYWIVNLLAVEGDRTVVLTLAARADVARLESDRSFRVPLEQQVAAAAAPTGIEWNISRVNAPALWALGIRGQGITYANADTGVQWDHPALKLHYRGWNGVSANHNFTWWDAIHSDLSGNGTNPCGFSVAAPCDDLGHGTHTLGTGVGDDGAGNQVGMAPGANWISCRNMDEGFGRPSTYIECMQFFMAPTDLAGNNPDPIRRPAAVGNSYGCPSSEGCTPASLQSATDNMRSSGIFMAISAGNTGSACSTITDPPSNYASAVDVGATGYLTDTIAGFSSRGPVTNNGPALLKPDLVAPGTNVRSTLPGNSYGTLTGTSMASPHVAGAVVLLWSAFPRLRGNVDTTLALLERTAVHLTTTQGCGGDSPTQVPNNVYGYGRLDVLAAYNNAATIRLPILLKQAAP